MDIEVKIDEKYDNPKIVIYTNKVDAEISNIIDGISSINQKNVVKKVLVKSLAGFTVGVTLLMVAYASVYFISDTTVFQNEIAQLQNIKTLITQITVNGISYYLLFIIFHIFSSLQNKELKEQYMNTHPYKFVLTGSIEILVLLWITVFMISNPQIYSSTIKTLNLIILVLVYALVMLKFVLKCTKESYFIKKINKKIKERNS